MTKIAIIVSGNGFVSTIKEQIVNVGISEIDVEVIDEKDYQPSALHLSKELIINELEYSEKLLKVQSFQQQQKDLRFMNKRKKIQ